MSKDVTHVSAAEVAALDRPRPPSVLNVPPAPDEQHVEFRPDGDIWITELMDPEEITQARAALAAFDQ